VASEPAFEPTASLETIEGAAWLTGDGGVMVRTAAGPLHLRPRRLVLTPRARPIKPAWWGANQMPPIAPLEFTGPDPTCVLVLGGGQTGVEAAAGWADGHRRVVLVEPQGRLLPDWDDDLAASVQAALAVRGVTVLTGWRATALSGEVGPTTVRLRHGGGVEDRLEPADLVVPALGWRPDLAGLALERTRALSDRFGFLQVDSRLETAEPRLHALGVAIAVPLTRAAVTRQAGLVVACAAGHGTAPLRYGLMPRVIRGPHAVLTAGLTVADARARGFRAACGRAGDELGWVRCVRDAETGALIGLQAAGPGAADLAEVALELLTDEGAAAGTVFPAALGEALRRSTEGMVCDG